LGARVYAKPGSGIKQGQPKTITNEGGSMSISITQAIIITLFCMISNLMFPLLGDIGTYFGLGRPLIAGTITGLILGDVKTGMLIGASLNAVYMSAQAVGNVMATDVTLAGYIATALAMAGSNDPAIALALSIPIGLFGSMLFTLQNAVCVFFNQKCDRYAEKGNVKNMWWIGIVIPMAIFNIIRVVPTFLVVFYGSRYSTALESLMPDWLNNAMGVVGGMLPAVGMALLLKVILKKATHWCFFIIGFLAYSIFGISMVPLTLLAICLAVILARTKTGGGSSSGENSIAPLE